MVISHHRATNMPSLASINPLSCGSFFRGRGKTSSLSFPFIFAEQSYPRSLGGGRPCSRKVNLPCGTKAERDLPSLSCSSLPPQTDFHCIFDTPSPFRVDKEEPPALQRARSGTLVTDKKKDLKVSSPKILWQRQRQV